MGADVEVIKARVSIVDLVTAAGLTVTGGGRIRSTAEHDSLKLWTETNTWRWFSRDVGGDVFDWWLAQNPGGSFRDALAALAPLAGVTLAPLSEADELRFRQAQAQGKVLKLAADWFHGVLMEHPAGRPGRAYCEARGWDRETLARERLGFCPGLDRLGQRDEGAEHNADYSQPLSKALVEAGLMEHPASRAVLSMPAGMLVYVHRRGGQVVYLSGRSIEGKRHWNLPGELVGARQVYHGSPARLASGGRLVVEGQADAVALGQMGFAAVGLCGVSSGEWERGRAGERGAGW